MKAERTKYPLVSVGVPVYNRAGTLARALSTLLAQDYPTLEILVSDNASTDGSTDICRRFAAQDKRIKLNLNRENLGMMPNFEIVRRMARGKYFMWAGSDDYWEPGFISALAEALERDPQAAVAQSAVKRVWDDGTLHDVIRYGGPYNPNQLTPHEQLRALLRPRLFPLKHNLFLCGLIRADLLEKMLGFDLNIHYMSDRPMLSILAMAHPFRYVDRVLFIKTMYHGSFTKRILNDPYTRILGNAWANPRFIVSIAHMLWRNPLVPKERRRWIPGLLFPLLLRAFRLQLKQLYWYGIRENFFLGGSRVKRMLGLPPRAAG